MTEPTVWEILAIFGRKEDFTILHEPLDCYKSLEKACEKIKDKIVIYKSISQFPFDNNTSHMIFHVNEIMSYYYNVFCNNHKVTLSSLEEYNRYIHEHTILGSHVPLSAIPKQLYSDPVSRYFDFKINDVVKYKYVLDKKDITSFRVVVAD